MERHGFLSYLKAQTIRGEIFLHSLSFLYPPFFLPNVISKLYFAEEKGHQHPRASGKWPRD